MFYTYPFLSIIITMNNISWYWCKTKLTLEDENDPKSSLDAPPQKPAMVTKKAKIGRSRVLVLSPGQGVEWRSALGKAAAYASVVPMVPVLYISVCRSTPSGTTCVDSAEKRRGCGNTIGATQRTLNKVPLPWEMAHFLLFF